MMTNTIEDLKNAVETKKRENISTYKDVFTPEDMNDFIQKCWNTVPEATKFGEKKFKKLAFDINRALSTFKNPEEAIENFKSLNQSESSDKPALFTDHQFLERLKNTHSVLAEGSVSPNIQMYLSTSILDNVNEEEKDKLYEITANIIVGVITNKGLSRSIDSEIVGDHNKIDSGLIASVANYVNHNFSKLKAYDNKILRFIGGYLKEEYKDLSDKNIYEIQKKFNSVDPNTLASAKKVMPTGAVANITGTSHPRSVKEKGLARQ